MEHSKQYPQFLPWLPQLLRAIPGLKQLVQVSPQGPGLSPANPAVTTSVWTPEETRGVQLVQARTPSALVLNPDTARATSTSAAWERGLSPAVPHRLCAELPPACPIRTA